MRARMLALVPLLCRFALAAWAGSALAAQTGSAPAPDVLAEVAALQAEGEHERALQVLEAARLAAPGEARLERALAQALERFVDAGGSWALLGDAREAWDRALALEPAQPEARHGAIAVRLRLGESAEALALAERALGAAWLAGGTAPPELLELACRARLGTLPAAGSGERGAALAEAWGALANARALAPGSSELVRLAAGLLDAEGLSSRAADELVHALERQPEAEPLPASDSLPSSESLHRALAELYAREGVEERLAPLYERWSAAGTNATLAWATGQAWRLAADLALRERRFASALEAYERAAQWMGVAGTLEARARPAAEAARFLAQVSAGWCELEAGALDAASERLLPLLRANAAGRAEPDGLGRSLLDALLALGERRVALGDFARAAAEARAVVALLSDSGTWWNNLGFLLRENATQLSAGKIAGVPEREREPRARALYQESWQAYRRAVELLPRDARVLNDAALVQVYHLRDNLGEAEALLERAVRAAEEQLAELGAAPEERARFPLAEALGNACANLGYLNYHVYRQNERARTAFERARASDSGARPELDAYLAALAGQRGPVPEEDRGALVPAPLASAPPRAFPAWEASLAEARARAQAEGRVLVVYLRGAGLGWELDGLDALVTRPELVRATAGAVWVAGDAGRQTFVERRHDGRRVDCPRLGVVTCGEHQRVQAELDAWFTELLGAPPGASEEGLWLLAPGSEAPERVREPERLAELVARGTPTPVAPAETFEAVEASMGGEDGGGEARTLVATRSLGARLAVESILWDGFRSSPARAHVLAALAEDANDASRALLAACVRQHGDPELQRAALAVWPAGAELAPVLHAWQWSTDAAARAAAEELLRRMEPDAPRWTARAALGAR
jgi:tetratricopeptide (TPR) repeat protein